VCSSDLSGQTLSFVLTTDNELLFAIQPTIDPAGNLHFTPAHNADGIANVTVVLHDSGGTERGGFDTATTETFVIRVAKLHLSHNAAEPLDATGDTAITTGDAMTCINYLNTLGPIRVTDGSLPEGEFLDVNGDGILNPNDPLKVINFLNSFGPRPAGASIPLGEGEAPAASPPVSVSADASTIIALLAADTVQTRRRRL